MVVGREIMPFIDFGSFVDEYCFPKPQLAAMQDKPRQDRTGQEERGEDCNLDLRIMNRLRPDGLNLILDTY